MKGTKELMIIFHKILEKIPKAILLIGGNIKKENKRIIKRMIKKLKIPSHNIIFYPNIKNENLKYFYMNSTLTLYTAIDEPFGQIPLESMKYKTPVIAFEGGGPSETIQDGKTGFLIKNFDLEDFAEKAIDLIMNKELYYTFCQNAKYHVTNNFNFERSVSQLLLIIRKYLVF